MTDKVRNIISYESNYEELTKSALDSYKSLFPIETIKTKLELQDIWVDDNLNAEDYSAQKEIKGQRGSWTVPIYGKFNLVDKSTGKVIEKVNKYKISDLPKVTPRNTFIWKGVEYQSVNLLRRKPGVYLRKKESNEVEAFFNLAKGLNFKFTYDPSDRKFSVLFGTRRIPGYSLLKALDVPDSQLKSVWGDEVYASNYKEDVSKDIDRIYNVVFRKPMSSKEEAKEALKEYFSKTELDPNVAKAFIKKSYKNVSPSALVDTTVESLNIARGKSKPLNSESLFFKSFHTMEDFVNESFKQEGKEIQRKLKRNLSFKKDLNDILYRPALASPIKRLFSLNVVRTPEQTNPLHILDETMKTTILGEGGIQDEHQITLAMRDIDHTSTGFIDPIQTPEGSSVGIINFLTLASGKRGTEIVTPFKDIKTNKIADYSPAQMVDKVILFPGQTGSTKLKAMKNGEVLYTDRKNADFEFPASDQIFGASSNMIPFLHSIGGGRAGIASRFSSQAISLVNREKPLVAAAIEGKPVTQLFGDAIIEKAPVSGKVSRVGKDFIEITDNKGKKHKSFFYKDFYLNDKNYLDSTPVVSEGDQVKAGDQLVELNYTKDGQLALGTNLKVGYLPYYGLNELDSMVISETASKKLTSEHVYQFDIELDEDLHTNLQKYSSLYPSRLNKDQKEKLDANGVVQVGAKVEPGDTIAALLKYRKDTPEDLILGRLSRGLVNRFKDHSLKWDRVEPGVVSDVVVGKKHISIFIKSQEPARIADKLSNLSAGKGTIGAIIPDDQMPKDKEGNPLEILLPPAGVISRLNPSQLYETMAGKIAKKIGKQILVNNFEPKNQFEEINKMMKKYNVSDTETLIDPKTNKEIKDVFTGNQYFYKLKHQALDKASSRYKGVYSVLDQPVRGGAEGSKSLDALTYYSLLSHGATSFIKDVMQKSEKNDDLWRAIELGETLPAPKPTFAYDTFQGYLKAMGVNLQKQGRELKLLPLTNKNIKEMSNGKIEKGKMLDRNLRPEKGGLFDPVKTGGLLGSAEKWTHVELNEPLPNPIMEKPITGLLGLTEASYNKIVDGTLFITREGSIVDKSTPGAITGGKAIERLLSKVDLDKEYKVALEEAKGKTGSDLDKINRKLRSIRSLKTLGIKNPADAYILKNVPVIPPKMRPIYPLPDGSLETSDFNYLYRDIILTNNLLKESKDLEVPEAQERDLRNNLYRSIKALYGLGDPISGYYHKKTGILPMITGSSPKEGYFQSKLLSKEQDLVGRSVIIPSEDLHTDEVGIPERLAWNLFKPFVVREYTSRGYSPIEAVQKIDSRDPESRRFLEMTMDKHPVLLNRAPSLHRFSIMAFKPKLSEGEGMKINPLVATGFNADFDGDAMTIHVPFSNEAIKEAYTMLPSQHVINPSTGKFMLIPQEESMAGIYKLSLTAEGRKKLNSVLPASYYITEPINKGKLQKLLTEISEKDPSSGAIIADSLKKLGDEYAYSSGYSFKFEDLRPIKRPDLVDKYMTKVHKTEDLNVRVSLLQQLTTELDANLLKNKSNMFVEQTLAGVKGKLGNARQILTSPVMTQDIDGAPVPIFIEKSYSEGLSLPDYIVASQGARKGLVDKGIEVAEPGKLAKEFAAAGLDYKVTEKDCGATRGLVLPINNQDVLDRYLAAPVHVGGKTIAKRNQLVDPELVQLLKKNKVTSIEVRSPLYCKSVSGSCSMCAGLGADGQAPNVGDYYGVFAAQALSEPATQAALSTPHKGGVAGTGSPDSGLTGLTKIRTLLEMPKNFAGQATVAENSGVVKRVTQTPDLTEIEVDDTMYSLPGNTAVEVKEGDAVARGSRLTTGLINPNDVYRTKGLPEMRNYLRDELLNAYRSEGIPVRSNVVESVVAATTKAGVVRDPGDSEFLPGDFIRIAQAEAENEKKELELDVSSATGRTLMENIGPIRAGTEIDNKISRELKANGVKKVRVKPNPIQYDPFIRGISQIPLAKEDFMSRLGYRELKNTIEEGVARGWTSDLDGYSPIPQYITSA